jgi:Na+/melibiose symporter-like transporter
MQVLKKDDARKFFAQKNLFVQIISIGIYFVTSALLDKYENTDLAYWVFFGYFSVILALFLIELFLRICLYKPAVTETTKITTKQTLTEPLKNRQTRKVIILNTMFYFAVDMGLLFMSVYQIKYLGYSYIFIAILFVISKLSSVAGGILWNRIVNKKQDYKTALTACCLLIFAAFVCLAAFGGISIYIMAILSAMIGVGESGIALYQTNAVYESAPDGMKIATISNSKFFHGIAGIIIAVLSLIFVKENNNELVIRVFFAAAAVSIFLCLLYAAVAKEKKS